MPDETLSDALRRRHDALVPAITRTEIEGGARRDPRRRPSRRGALVAAALLLALVAGGLAVRALTDDVDDDVTAGPGSDRSAWCSALEAPALVGLPIVVFLEPGLDPSTLAEVDERLHSAPGVDLVRYYDPAAALAQARVLFADQPTMLALLREEDIPTSFRVTVGDAGQEQALARRAVTWSGVQQVETRPTGWSDGARETGRAGPRSGMAGSGAIGSSNRWRSWRAGARPRWTQAHGLLSATSRPPPSTGPSPRSVRSSPPPSPRPRRTMPNERPRPPWWMRPTSGAAYVLAPRRSDPPGPPRPSRGDLPQTATSTRTLPTLALASMWRWASAIWSSG